MKNLILLISTIIALSVIMNNPVFAIPIEGNPEEFDRFGMTVAAGDFNGDNIDDLAIAVPFEDGDTSLNMFDVGSINVIYGSETEGLTDEDNTAWNQGAKNIVDHTEEGDLVGVSLAAGDFNNDGKDDLAVGVPFEDLQISAANMENEGAVHVIYGSESGLSDLNNQIWYPGISGILDRNPDEHGSFGFKVAAGDFNGDGADDLAISSPVEDVEGVADSGAVNVIYGKTGCGLTAADNQVWDQGPLRGILEIDDEFGQSIAAGDFNGDTFDDLAVGVMQEDITITTSGEQIIDIGAVNVIYGSGSGLRVAGNQVWDEVSLDLDISHQNRGDHFGGSLASGDFNGDGFDDLAVGANDFDVEASQLESGLLLVLYGSQSRLTSNGLDTFSQPEEVEAGDGFAFSLVAGSFTNRTGEVSDIDDLAIGVPSEDLVNASNAGMVNVMHGSGDDGITDEESQIWHQNLVTILGNAGSNEHFGGSVTAGDFNGDGFDDLAVGVSQDFVPKRESVANVSKLESLGNVTKLEGEVLAETAGAVNVIYAARDTGLSPEGNQWWFQDWDPDNPPGPIVKN